MYKSSLPLSPPAPTKGWRWRTFNLGSRYIKPSLCSILSSHHSSQLTAIPLISAQVVVADLVASASGERPTGVEPPFSLVLLTFVLSTVSSTLIWCYYVCIIMHLPKVSIHLLAIILHNMYLDPK